ncbi:MAG TPA: YciI family protein [bacterium]|nr:YciI family protein [bacterium]
MEFDSYTIVFLMTGPNRGGANQTDLELLQHRHLEHLRRLHQEGFALVAGPFGEQTDESFRGLVIFRGDLSREKVLELAQEDPAVKAGRLRVEAVRWYCEKNYVEFPHKTQH